MTPMYGMLLFFSAIAILSIIGIITIFISTNPKVQQVLLGILTVWSGIIFLFSFSSLPSNNILERMITSLLFLPAIAGYLLFKFGKNTVTLSKILISISIIGGLLFMLISGRVL